MRAFVDSSGTLYTFNSIKSPGPSFTTWDWSGMSFAGSFAGVPPFASDPFVSELDAAPDTGVAALGNGSVAGGFEGGLVWLPPTGCWAARSAAMKSEVTRTTSRTWPRRMNLDVPDAINRPLK